MTESAVVAALRQAQAKAKRESLELALLQQLRAMKLDAGMQRQWRPFEDVGYRFDFAWPNHDPIVLVEVEGGIWSRGAHARPKGIIRDIEKGNRASLAGYVVIRATGDHVKSGQAIKWIQQGLRHVVA